MRSFGCFTSRKPRTFSEVRSWNFHLSLENSRDVLGFQLPFLILFSPPVGVKGNWHLDHDWTYVLVLVPGDKQRKWRVVVQGKPKGRQPAVLGVNNYNIVARVVSNSPPQEPRGEFPLDGVMFQGNLTTLKDRLLV